MKSIGILFYAVAHGLTGGVNVPALVFVKPPNTACRLTFALRAVEAKKFLNTVKKLLVSPVTERANATDASTLGGLAQKEKKCSVQNVAEK